LIIIFDFKKSILISKSVLCKGPFIYPKDDIQRVKNGHSRHYITINVIILMHAISLLKVVKKLFRHYLHEFTAIEVVN